MITHLINYTLFFWGSLAMFRLEMHKSHRTFWSEKLSISYASPLWGDLPTLVGWSYGNDCIHDASWGNDASSNGAKREKRERRKERERFCTKSKQEAALHTIFFACTLAFRSEFTMLCPLTTKEASSMLIRVFNGDRRLPSSINFSFFSSRNRSKRRWRLPNWVDDLQH